MRLKHRIVTVVTGDVLCPFNTKKVRLKLDKLDADIAIAVLFQYQKGAIKTAARTACGGSVDPFQYQKGAIKTGAGDQAGDLVAHFQYQKGAIKTLEVQVAWRLWCALSIPKRCD